MIDPLLEVSSAYSPFVYGNNNPLRFIDPDGLAVREIEGGLRYDVQDAIDKFSELQREEDSRQNESGNPKKKSKSGTKVGVLIGEKGNDDDANQGGPGPHNGYDLNPNSVGHNYFSSVYIGPNNPVSYNGLKYYYNIAPKNRADARLHDLGYDAVHAKGVASVFFDTDALPADFKLIGNEFSLGANPFNGATYTERAQGFLISIGIGIAIIPKAIIYGLSAVKN